MPKNTNPSSCHVMAKPSSSICNLDCSYCFYLEKDKLYPDRNNNWKMSEETLEVYIKQQILAQDVSEVVIAWQGGEPTLLGLDFYKKAVEIANQNNPNNKRIIHTFQTNGLLLDDQWCRFFKKHNFLIGISVDGPSEEHDKYRVNRSGKPTHLKIEKAIKCLRKHKVEFNTLTVVNDKNVTDPEKIYRYLKSIGSAHIQFIPLVERRANQPDENGLYYVNPDHKFDAEIEHWSVTSEQFGDFLIKIFSIWITEDVGKVYIQMFEHTFSKWLGENSLICFFSEKCGNAFSLESNGDLYNCDHYVYPKHKLGNIHTTTIKKMSLSEKHLEFSNQKKDLSSNCQSCDYLFLCNGGCPKHRFIHDQQGKPNHNYFCYAYRKFFSFSEPYMVAMSELKKRNIQASHIMSLL